MNANRQPDVYTLANLHAEDGRRVSVGKCINCGAALGTSGPFCESCLLAGKVRAMVAQVLEEFGPHVKERKAMLSMLVDLVEETWKR